MHSDVADGVHKLLIAQRVIKNLQRSANVQPFQHKWQDIAHELKTCDLIFGCVDGFRERNELETCARRYLIPYIDIGMDVHCIKGHPPRMAGQIILSMPEEPW